MRVFVYRNLHKNCLSVKCKKTNRVIAHVDSIFLENVKFKVSKKGRERVLREKRKNVHAGLEGEWIKNPQEITTGGYKAIYNPYKYETFVNAETLEPQESCALAYITINGAMVINHK